jgi:hypothetical protein
MRCKHGETARFTRVNTPHVAVDGPDIRPIGTAEVVDLSAAGTLRRQQARPLRSVSLPAFWVRVTVILPRFSEPGQYLVAVSLDQAGGEVPAEGRGASIYQDGGPSMSAQANYASNDADLTRESTVRDAESRCIHGRVCFRRCGRQCEVERRAKPAVAVGPDPSAMRFNDRLADCQAHAAAL